MQGTLKRAFAGVSLVGVAGAAGTLVNLGTAPGRADEAKGAPGPRRSDERVDAGPSHQALVCRPRRQLGLGGL